MGTTNRLALSDHCSAGYDTYSCFMQRAAWPVVLLAVAVAHLLVVPIPLQTHIRSRITNKLTLTHQLKNTTADVKDETIDLSDQELKFKGKSGEKEYEVNIEFFKKVDSEGSTYKVLPRSVQMLLKKGKEDQDEFWPRLLNDKALEKNQVKVDWDRYVDEDEEGTCGNCRRVELGKQRIGVATFRSALNLLKCSVLRCTSLTL